MILELRKHAADILTGIWLFFGIVGDEIYGYIFLTKEANIFSIGQPWWWIYQVGLAVIFLPIILHLRREKNK